MFMAVRFLIFIILFYGLYSFMKYINQNRVISTCIQKAISKSEKSFSLRKEKEELRRLEDGNLEKTSLLYSLDLMIERSGLRLKYPFLSTEIYIFITIMISVAGFLLINFLTGLWILGVFFCMAIIVSSYALVYSLSSIAYNRTDSALIPFINILENYAGTSDDIVSILAKTSYYLEDPLKSNIEEFYNEINTSGNITLAFRHLELRVENERFRDIIRNLEICSRHEANYQEIIRDIRSSLIKYLDAKQKRKVIIKQGRLEILALLGLSGVMIGMFTSFSPNLISSLFNSFVGNLILLYCTIVVGICLFTMISFGKK